MKVLLTLALMLALLAIGTTAAAGPFGVNMGDPIKPDAWIAGGFGIEVRIYEGGLPFDRMGLEGTRQGGVCNVRAEGRVHNRETAVELYYNLRVLLVDRYGKPDIEETETTFPKARWLLENVRHNPDKIVQFVLWVSKYDNNDYRFTLQYFFENARECENAKADEL